MPAVLYTLTSDLHGELAKTASGEPFIKDIEAAMGEPFIIRNGDYSDIGTHPLELIYVRTGGTEGIFRSLFEKDGTLVIPEPVRLLTSGRSNSLAASMEILSYLNQHGIKGEILHGSPGRIAEKIGEPSFNPAKCSKVREISPSGKILEGKRLGVVGRPSDWLISSDVDYAAAKASLGVELIDVPMEELLGEIKAGGHPQVSLPALNVPKFGNPIPESDLEGALEIYGALKRIISKYELNGLTLRCFDLLTAVHNTGCMALALLNAEGFTATCEGDVPAMLTMAVSSAVCGISGFQANLSKAEGDSLLFAHCTVPLGMVRGWVYDTHFESGFGVAVHGELLEGPATIFKIAPDFKTALIAEAVLDHNQYEGMLCRTQIVMDAPGLKDYFLCQPIGNHHVIIPGRQAKKLYKALI